MSICDGWAFVVCEEIATAHLWCYEIGKALAVSLALLLDLLRAGAFFREWELQPEVVAVNSGSLGASSFFV